MLKEISLEHFKCFKKATVPLSALTLLTGFNSSGKSTLLQAILLLHQTMNENEWSSNLKLNGQALRLGSVRDILNNQHSKQSFSVSLTFDAHKISWTFSGERDEMSMKILEVKVDESIKDTLVRLNCLIPETSSTDVMKCVNLLRDVSYISAERSGPKDSYVLVDKNDLRSAGSRGENVASIIYWNGDTEISEQLAISDEPKTLLKQAEARMNSIFPGSSFSVDKIPDINALLLRYRTSPEGELHLPSNVGFGISQVFPIVIAGLSARQKDILIIENPEVHLHPQGQSLLAYFLAEVAASGVQVLVESHSDHVLNGIRLAVLERILNSKDASIQFFRLPDPNDERQIVDIMIDQDGRIADWPDGFFDQLSKDLLRFI